MITQDGNRVEQVLRDKVTGKEVSRGECQHGYEFAKDQYVTFTSEELKAMDEGDKGMMDIQEFVPVSTIDHTRIEKTYHLDSGKGGDRAYRLLVKTMAEMSVVAVAQWSSRGRQHLVTIVSREGHLVLNQMYYADEVRDFELDCATYSPKDAEIDIAKQLVSAKTSSHYDDSKYRDGYRDRVKDAVEAKKSGQEPSSRLRSRSPK